MAQQSAGGGAVVGGSVDSLGAAAGGVGRAGESEAVVHSYIEARFQVGSYRC